MAKGIVTAQQYIHIIRVSIMLGLYVFQTDGTNINLNLLGFG